MRALVASLALGGLAACGAPPHSKSAGGVEPLAIRPVPWNAAQTAVGNVRAVADTGETVCIFSDDGATVLSPAGALVAHDTRVKNWVSGDAIYAVGESTAKWIIGVDGAGHLYRLKAMSAFEDVGARYQLSARKIHSATVLGPSRVGFLLDGNEIALTDSEKISIFGSSGFSALAGGGGFAAGVSKDAIEIINATNGIVTRFELPDAAYAALDSKGRLYAATKRAVYAYDPKGALELVYDANHDRIHGLVASGDRVWFADDTELGMIEQNHVSLTNGAKIDARASLQRSPTGDVWVVGKQLARYTAGVPAAPTTPNAPVAVATAQPTIQTSWSTAVSPIFARSCAKCHQPDGVSGVDLSTEAAWKAKRDLINDRVLVTHTMPPDKNQITDGDRDTIHAWLMSAK